MGLARIPKPPSSSRRRHLLEAICLCVKKKRGENKRDQTKSQPEVQNDQLPSPLTHSPPKSHLRASNRLAVPHHGGNRRRVTRVRRWRRRGRTGAVPAQDVRDGGRPVDGRGGVVERRLRRKLRGLELARVRGAAAAHLLQARQLLQLHPPAQHLRA
jgi:hypothetical protein